MGARYRASVVDCASYLRGTRNSRIIGGFGSAVALSRRHDDRGRRARDARFCGSKKGG